MKHKIIDNYLPNEYFKNIQTAIVRNEQFPWNRINELNVFQSSNDRDCLLYTSPSPRDRQKSRMPSSA